MIPIPVRVLFPALVSLVSGLWALAEWRDHRAVHVAADVDDDETQEIERCRLEVAERMRKLREARGT
jgi:hypothetical protein